ncbi:phosphoethanolamine transferase [Solimonas sp. K1W22B-7]|uniref:phosphoethanolamine transferase n=1 Tax=Solimonas sp. K1W22B-7 TaxID=2303331 RepID=UPI000E32F044|nr:phosphoethanolamine--lipid A transferase [Solimonas sp. K1W22B-7]AXQ30424.1 phosphoethanolamine transferase [Solimonas sp. K1W22B-7]
MPLPSKVAPPARADAAAPALILPAWAWPFALPLPRLPVISANRLLMLVVAYLALTQNLSFLHAVVASVPSPAGPQEVRIMASAALALVTLLTLALAPFAWRRTIKPALVLFLVTAAVCSYFMDSFGTVIDKSMLVNVARTDRHEAGDLLQLGLVVHVLLQGLLPAWLVIRWPLRLASPWLEARRRLTLAASMLAVFLAVFLAQQQTLMIWGRIHRDVRVYVNPTFPLHAVKGFAEDNLWQGKRPPPQPIATDAVRQVAAGARPLLVVLVVGETTRAANFQLNGYGRATTPRLAQLPGLVNYPDVSSCGTYTAESVPCMFSIDGREHFSRKRAEKQENLLDVLKRVGVAVGWRDNDGGCQNTCNRVGMESLNSARNPVLCSGGECHDGILLEDLQRHYPAAGAKLLVLHTKGSHGPAYYKRYPDSARLFTPDCRDANVQRCTQQELVNAYDNTIAYTDQVLAQLVEKLRAQQGQMDMVMIYVSDHGESLGENGIYLHGLPWQLAPPEQKHVPMVAWFSDGAPAALGLDMACVNRASKAAHSHDDLFSTLLGLFAVKTRAYAAPQDLFGACRAGPADAV